MKRAENSFQSKLVKKNSNEVTKTDQRLPIEKRTNKVY